MKKLDDKKMISKIIIPNDSPKIQDDRKNVKEPQVPNKKKKFFSSPVHIDNINDSSKKVIKKSK